MTCAGTDHDALAWMDVEQFIVQLHSGTRFAFEKVVGLDQLFVIMKLIVESDLRDVDGARKILDIRKRSSSGSAWAGNPG